MKKNLLVLLSLFFVTSGVVFAKSKKLVPVVKIPLDNVSVVAAQKGWLQEEYAKYGSKIELVDPGTVRLAGVEASLLDRGDLHFAGRMSYPALVHKLNGLDAVIIRQLSEATINTTPLFVLKDSPINAVKELEGKKFGSGRIGCGWTSPYEIFLDNNLPLDTEHKKGKIRYSAISSGVANQQALLSGRIDATSMHPTVTLWTPLFTQDLVKVIGHNRADGVYVQYAGRTATFAMRNFAEEHPELIKAYLVVYDKTRKWILANPDEASVIIARGLRIPKHIAKFGIVDPSSSLNIPDEESWEGAVKAIKEFQKWYKENGDDILSKKQLPDREIEKFVVKNFFKGGEYSIFE